MAARMVRVGPHAPGITTRGGVPHRVLPAVHTRTGRQRSRKDVRSRIMNVGPLAGHQPDPPWTSQGVSHTAGCSGPFFDGRLDRDVSAMATDAVQQIASTALHAWHQGLDARIRYATPYYETQITDQRIGAHERVVHDRGVVYGPWLEGTGSRNRRTRFRGYWSLARAVADTLTRIDGILERVAARHLAGD